MEPEIHRASGLMWLWYFFVIQYLYSNYGVYDERLHSSGWGPPSYPPQGQSLPVTMDLFIYWYICHEHNRLNKVVGAPKSLDSPPPGKRLPECTSNVLRCELRGLDSRYTYKYKNIAQAVSGAPSRIYNVSRINYKVLPKYKTSASSSGLLYIVNHTYYIAMRAKLMQEPLEPCQG